MVKLKKVDLPIEANDEGIKPHAFYLAKMDDGEFNKNGKFITGLCGWYAGTFTKEEYGWNFDAVYDAGFQYNYPSWKELYEIVDKELTEFYKGLEDKVDK